MIGILGIPKYEGYSSRVLSTPVIRFQNLIRKLSADSPEGERKIEELGIHPDIQPRVAFLLRFGYFLFNSNQKTTDYVGEYFSNRKELEEQLTGPMQIPLVIVPHRYLVMFGGQMDSVFHQQKKLLEDFVPGDKYLNLLEARGFSMREGETDINFSVINLYGEASAFGVPFLMRNEARVMFDVENDFAY